MIILKLLNPFSDLDDRIYYTARRYVFTTERYS